VKLLFAERRALALLLLPLLLAMDATGYRFHRTIEGAAGWTEVELSDDVLDAARPGLPDLRILSETGEEIPYALGGALASAPVRLQLFDVEKRDQETTALADRGDRTARADMVEIEVGEAEFIKPVTLEVSSDRAAWSEIARGSIFATPSGARMTTLHFAPSDRRYWRFRFDDRHGPPLTVAHVVVGMAALRETPPRVVGLDLKTEPDTPSASAYSAVLPSKNLPLAALRVHATDAAFVRRVRVFERVVFRDEVRRRLLGEGDIARSATGDDRSSVALSEPSGKHLEIEIDRSGGVPLHGVKAEITLEPRALRFHVPAGSTPELVYGSSAGAARYDVGAALRSGPPSSFTKAKLGAVSDRGSDGPALPAVLRGGALKTADWKTEQPIVLPAQGPVAYLDLDRGGGPLNDLRIIDATGRQVPYVVEAEPRLTRLALAFRTERAGGESRLHVEGLLPDSDIIEALELEITSPNYFARDVRVVEQLFDARGKTDQLELGTARLVKAADRPPGPFRIAIRRPRDPHVFIHIADGDNAPLTVASISVEKSRRRINFVFAAGDELRLLSGNHAAPVPHYDLALVAPKVLSSPAEAAALGQARAMTTAVTPPPAWFWLLVLVAALILLFVLRRILAQMPKQSG
jgi:hypothetical protein